MDKKNQPNILGHYRMFWEILDSRGRRIFLFLIFINLVNAVLEIASVGALFPIIYSLLSPDSLNSIPVIKNFLENYAPARGRDFIIIALGVSVFAFILKNIFFGFVIWYRSVYVEKIVAKIAEQLFNKYMHSPYQYHIQRNTAEIIRNITHCIEVFRNYFLFTTLEVFTYGSIGVSYLVFLTYIDPTLMTYFIIIMSIFILIITIKIRRITKKLGYRINEVTQERNHYLLQGLMGFKEIKVLLKENFFTKMFNRLTESLKDQQAKSQFFYNVPRLIIENAIVFLAITAIMILFSQDQKPELIIAKLGVFGFAALKIFPMFNLITSMLSVLAIGGANLEVLHKELVSDTSEKSDLIKNLPPLIPGLSKPKSLYTFKKSIKLKNIHFHFYDQKNERKKVINGIDLTIKKNTIIGLVGESGSGKTTLVDIIIGFMHPQQGEVLIDGKPLKQEGVWSDKIGYIPQQIYLSNTSIKENVALGWEKDIINERRVWQVLEIARLAEMVKGLDEGINTEVGESGVKLSGGQRQRIGIARALYHNPELLILDEATSALDNRTELEFVNQLKSLKVKTTQMIIAHRLSTVKHCDRIYVLDKGRIVEQGNYAQLERSGKYFRRMLLKDLKKKSPKKPSPKPKGT